MFTPVRCGALVVLLAASCGTGGDQGRPADPPAPVDGATLAAGLPSADLVVERSGSWAPAPRQVDGRSVLADTDGGKLRVHTAGGVRTYLPGVNLGATKPGQLPGEIDSLTAADYRAWFEVAGRLGFRVIRIYTVHPPAFYDELARYAHEHPAAPLYLMQGAYFADEDAYAAAGDLWDPAVTDGFRQELTDAHKAVTGQLERPAQAGRSSGRWTTDVSALLVGWIVGIELDPVATTASDRGNATRPPAEGRWFRSTPEATPTERWYAGHLDELAGLEAGSGRSVPLAFVNWPTTDPLRHPDEPTPEEDYLQIDANHVRATAEWPGGTFASYHAYPYFPDFLWVQPDLQGPEPPDGRPDPYRAYVRSLVVHHAEAGLPVLVSETGVPSSWGLAHLGPNGRDQGRHNEPQAMAIDADLLRITAEEGTAGGFVFALVDEWFKTTWNTQRLQLPPDRRALWSDAMCNEAHFGVIAADTALAPVLRLGDPPQSWWDHTRPLAPGGPLRTWGVAQDEGYLYLQLDLTSPLTPGGGQHVTVAVDTDPAIGAPSLPDGAPPGGADTAVVVSETDSRLWLTAQRDPVTVLERLPAPTDKGAVAPWVPISQLVNRAHPDPPTGPPLPAVVVDLSSLIEGTTDPASPRFDSRAQVWRNGTTLQLRLPWASLGFSDPSSRLIWVLAPDGTVTTRPVEQIGLTVRLDDRVVSATVAWEGWDTVASQPRVKVGAPALAAAVTELVARP